jgi:hypothetical protein
MLVTDYKGARGRLGVDGRREGRASWHVYSLGAVLERRPVVGSLRIVVGTGALLSSPSAGELREGSVRRPARRNRESPETSQRVAHFRVVRRLRGSVRISTPYRPACRPRLFEPAATLRRLLLGALSVAGSAGLVTALDP